MTRLLLVRHGQSEWNAAGLFQGQGGTGLSAQGIAEAEAIARLLAAEADLALIAHSDLQRVVETVAPTTAARPDLPVVSDQRLREVDVGTWTGRTIAEIAEFDPDGYAAWQRGEDNRRGGGETLAEVRARMAAALDDLAARAPEGTVAVFTHGAALRLAVVAALDVPVTAAERRMVPARNGSITELRHGPDGLRLGSYNATGHLVVRLGSPGHSTTPASRLAALRHRIA